MRKKKRFVYIVLLFLGNYLESRQLRANDRMSCLHFCGVIPVAHSLECAKIKSSQVGYLLLSLYILCELPLQIRDDHVLGLQLDFHIFRLRRHLVHGITAIAEKHKEEEGNRELLNKQIDVKHRRKISLFRFIVSTECIIKWCELQRWKPQHIAVYIIVSITMYKLWSLIKLF